MRTRPLLFLLLFLAYPTIAADDEPKTKRTCDDAAYLRLREAKLNACDRAGSLGCSPDLACTEIPNRIIKLNACIAARRAIMETCFKGGDEGHNRQVQYLENAIRNCFKELEKRCRGDEGCKE